MKRKICQVLSALIVFFSVNILFVACNKDNRPASKIDDLGSVGDEILDYSTAETVELITPSPEELFPDYIEPPVPDITADDIEAMLLGESDRKYWTGGSDERPWGRIYNAERVENFPKKYSRQPYPYYGDAFAVIRKATIEKISTTLPYEYSGELEIQISYLNLMNKEVARETKYGFTYDREDPYIYVTRTPVVVTYDGTILIATFAHVKENGDFYASANYYNSIKADDPIYYNTESIAFEKKQVERKREEARRKAQKEAEEARIAAEKAAQRASLTAKLQLDKLDIITIDQTELVHVKIPNRAKELVKDFIRTLDNTIDSKIIAMVENIYIPLNDYITTAESIVKIHNDKTEYNSDINSTVAGMFLPQYAAIYAGTATAMFRMYNVNQFPESIYPVNKKGGHEKFAADMAASIVTGLMLKLTEASYLQYFTMSVTERTRALKRATTEINRGNTALFNAIYPTLMKDRNIIVKGFLMGE
jgi:hypothetical protein